VTSISAERLKPLLTDGGEIAFLDIREHGQYGEGHPFFSVPMPYSRLEFLANILLPSLVVRLVLMDDGDGVADRAARRLESMGFQDVSILDGGAPAWAAAGYTLFKGVNVPSKTFGELVEHEAGTPTLTAPELKALLARDKSIVVLDGRTPAEYTKMSLPGAICCPNAELGYRIQSLVPDESATVVINCAGRTRSIIGTEGLRALRIRNPLYALENGTQGWALAGFDLANGVNAQALPEPDANQLASMTALADHQIGEYGLNKISPKTLEQWQRDETRSTYLLDVRTAGEYKAAHWPGARHAPGGQLVQSTDQYVAVRNARIVLSDDIHLRAATTGMWLKGMGHDVYILDADARAGKSRPENVSQSSPQNLVNLSELANRIADGATLLDASSSMQFREAHIEGAHWVTRSRLDRLDAGADERLLLTGQDDVLIEGVLTELKTLGYTKVSRCSGSPEEWATAGLSVISSENDPIEDDCIDYLFFVHDRHDGNLEAARRYLEWETGLLKQLDVQEKSVLNPQCR